MAKANQRQQHFDIAENDTISKLPDSLLCHILSFVSTKDLVATSCLSKRWRFTWTSVAVLDLSDQSFRSLHIPKRRRTSACIKSFKNFVNMVLILRSHPVVQRFKLQLYNAYAESDVHSWIFAAITHSVQELDLYMHNAVGLPRVVYNCATIVELKLNSKIELIVPEAVCLQNLKVLHLRNIPTLSDASVSRLLSGSPVLEELLIHTSYGGDDCKTFSIVSPSLKAFRLKHQSSRGNHYGVLIDAPKLKCLKLIDWRQQEEVEIEFKNAPSIAKAKFNYTCLSCHEEENIRTRTFGLQKLCKIKVLSLPLILLNKVHPLNRFHYLTILTVKFCGHDFLNLPRNLTMLPNLQFLILKKASCGAKCDSSKMERHEIHCFQHSLKTLQFEGFKMMIEDVEIVDYFVKNVRVLNEIRLLTNRYHSESEKAALRKLLTLPRCSNGFKLLIC